MKLLSKFVALTFLLPSFAFAATAEFKGLKEFFAKIIDFINNPLIPSIFALGFLVFIWGMFKAFILGGNNEEKQGEGKQLMMYAVIGFVVMVSLWGIVNLLSSGLGLDDKQIEPPTFKLEQ